MLWGDATISYLGNSYLYFTSLPTYLGKYLNIFSHFAKFSTLTSFGKVILGKALCFLIFLPTVLGKTCWFSIVLPNSSITKTKFLLYQRRIIAPMQGGYLVFIFYFPLMLFHLYRHFHILILFGRNSKFFLKSPIKIRIIFEAEHYICLANADIA